MGYCCDTVKTQTRSLVGRNVGSRDCAIATGCVYWRARSVVPCKSDDGRRLSMRARSQPEDFCRPVAWRGPFVNSSGCRRISLKLDSEAAEVASAFLRHQFFSARSFAALCSPARTSLCGHPESDARRVALSSMLEIAEQGDWFKCSAQGGAGANTTGLATSLVGTRALV